MKMSFRWYGPDDPVTLQNIRQIPNMQAIVTAVYDVPVGEVWSRKSIAALKKQTEDNGLQFEVIESVPVHEDIKLGKPTRDRYIEITARTFAALPRPAFAASATISCRCLTGRARSLTTACRTALQALSTIKSRWMPWTR